MLKKTRPPKSFQTSSRFLEETFFLEQDKVLIERLRAMKKMAETKEALSAVSGITNDAILSRLVELDIKPEVVAALVAVPLIEVAWADGKIDSEERELILTHANERGITPGSIEHDLLERWLTHRPEPNLLTAWQAYIQGLCERLTPDERKVLKEELLYATRATAEASGGFLGFGRISKKEQEVLDLLASSFGE